MDAGWYGSASTMIAASLQLSGEYAQAKILDAISFTNLKYLAVAIYILGFIGALISAALWQNYRIAIWLVLGPALWDIMTYTRQPTFDVRWEYAGTTRATETDIAKYSEAEKFTPPTKGPSTFFKLWDEIVSSSVQTVNKTIADLANDPATQLFARLNFQNSILRSVVQTPEIRQAMAIAMGPMCTVEVSKPAKLNPLTWSQSDVEKYNAELEEALLNTNIGVSVPQPIRVKLCQFTKVYNAWTTYSSGPLDFDRLLYNSSSAGSNSIIEDCKNGEWSAFSSGYEDPDAGIFADNCHTLSTAVWSSLVVEAELLKQSSLKHNGSALPSSISSTGSILPVWQKELSSVTNSSGPVAMGFAFEKLLANYLMRNTMHSLDFIAPSSRGVTEQSSIRDQTAMVANAKAEVDQNGARSWAAYFVRSVPYLQGSLLFVLSILFPFVAIGSLLPTLRSGLLSWMGAWVWVKSWDVGLYVVSLISGVLSENMFHKDLLVRYISPSSSGELTPTFSDVFYQVNTFQSALARVFPELDPIFAAAMLDYITAIMVVSIPVLTGAIFLMGRAAALSTLSGAFTSSTSDAFDRGKNVYLDTLGREFMIDYQEQRRQKSVTGAAVGAALGALTLNPYATIVGASMGGLVGQARGERELGRQVGTLGAAYMNQPGVFAPGNVVDPIEVLAALWGSQAAMGFIDQQIGMIPGGWYVQSLGNYASYSSGNIVNNYYTGRGLNLRR